MEVQILLLRAGTHQWYLCRNAPATGRDTSERELRSRTATSGSSAPQQQGVQRRSSRYSGTSTGSSGNRQHSDVRRSYGGLYRRRFWQRRQPAVARKALEGKGNLGRASTTKLLVRGTDRLGQKVPGGKKIKDGPPPIRFWPWRLLFPGHQARTAPPPPTLEPSPPIQPEIQVR